MIENDIFASWRGKKFVILDNDLYPTRTVVLVDFRYWSEEIDSLAEWCEKHGAVMKGMTVDFPTSECLTLFALRWA